MTRQPGWSSIRRLARALGAVMLVLALAGPTARAATVFSEQGDAGQLVGTAQTTVGPGSLSGILGSLLGVDDIDLYLLRINDPAAFSATTVAPGTEVVDTQLFLFTSTGLGLAAAGDAGPLETNATFPAGSLAALTPGVYLLGVAQFDDVPQSAAGLIFPALAPFDPAVHLPTGPGGTMPLIAWSVDQFSEPLTGYEIVLTGALPAVPEPASWLLALGLPAAIGYGRSLRRRR